VLLPRPVVAGGLLPHRLRHRGEREPSFPERRHRRFERGEEPACVAVGMADEELTGLGLKRDPTAVAPLVGHRPRQKGAQLVRGQGLEQEQLGPGEEGGPEGERRVLGRGSDEQDCPFLEEREEHILLGAVPAMDLVQEQEVPLPGPPPRVAGGEERLADLGHGGQRRRALDEPCPPVRGDEPADRGLPCARRPPEHEWDGHVPLEERPQGPPLPEEVPLPHHLPQVARPQPLRQGRPTLPQAFHSGPL